MKTPAGQDRAATEEGDSTFQARAKAAAMDAHLLLGAQRTCAICLERLNYTPAVGCTGKMEAPMTVLSCGHVFHAACICKMAVLRKVGSKVKCPCCRRQQIGDWGPEKRNLDGLENTDVLSNLTRSLLESRLRQHILLGLRRTLQPDLMFRGTRKVGRRRIAPPPPLLSRPLVLQ